MSHRVINIHLKKEHPMISEERRVAWCAWRYKCSGFPYDAKSQDEASQRQREHSAKKKHFTKRERHVR